MLMVSTTCMTVMFCNDSGGGGHVHVMAYYCFFVWFLHCIFSSCAVMKLDLVDSSIF